MDIFQAAVLGIAQGLTEFLPVSSSGHLVLIQNIMGIDSGSGLIMFFDIMLHLGTLVAVLFVLRKDIIRIIRNPLGKTMRLLIVATIPAVVLALLFEETLATAFGGSILGFSFLITGLLLVVSEKISKATRRFKDAKYKDALSMGLAQAVALLPGVSRAGSTMAGGLITGLDREAVARFSFLMAAIAIFGSFVFELKDIGELIGTVSIPWIPVIVGFIFSTISGLFAVSFMINFIKKNRLYGFAIYVFIIGAFVLIDQYVLHIVF